MKRKPLALALALALACLITTPSFAGTFEWTSGWGMGTSEYAVDDGNKNALLISCPSEGYVSAEATIQGERYDSESQPGFDLIVDGVTFSNPFYTDCRVCADIFKAQFWEAFRKANRLQLSVDGQVVNLPTTKLQDVTQPLDDPANGCYAAW
tara:strand:+ start:138 stop:593 length:456 start_codon:yes stop_codon:yes gene_type:complete